MVRKPRVHFPGALYHAISRGNQGQMIFRDDDDRERYLEDIVKVACSQFNVPPKRVFQREKGREISQLRWLIGKVAIEETRYRLVEVARFLSRDPGVMSRGLRQLEERLQKDRDLQKRIGRIQARIREGRKPRIAKRHA